MERLIIKDSWDSKLSSDSSKKKPSVDSEDTSQGHNRMNDVANYDTARGVGDEEVVLCSANHSDSDG